MSNLQEPFSAEEEKRLILVADDEWINRELLGNVLQDTYDVIYAADGQEALQKIEENKDRLSLVLLDLLMPVMTGLELLKRLKENASLRQIPVIVITSDQESEVESLMLGAVDFIPKPYPRDKVILARVLRTIELFENRQIIHDTERDPLTNLYNKEFFYRYAEQFDQHHKDTKMDAIVIDVYHFHIINERFGTAYADNVLRMIAEKVRKTVRALGGIVCRREADTFMIYCPHGADYNAILESSSVGLTGYNDTDSYVRLRMGVYADVDKTLDIARRFDRAKMAADTLRNSYTKNIEMYDNALHEKELYAERLIEDFSKAISQKQFHVYYQPKFDVRPHIPVLSSAEALVRWEHPELGMLSPGVFIPLFEENGLIQKLDYYVWCEAAAQIRDWKERFCFSVPVSVNVSRIDMYDPHLVDTFMKILKENDLETEDFLLEITESAYTQDSEQIIKTVNHLRELGFRIEMDDFGTGYSSLNMISTLPIDALKLDMQFVRNAFRHQEDTRMLEFIIDIAEYLAVPVIAEGVETEEQLNALKAIGCDVVQGYYFSKPVPANEYEKFIIERKNQRSGPVFENVERRLNRKDTMFGRITQALSGGFENIYYVDTKDDRYVEFSSDGKYEDLQIKRSGVNFFEELHDTILKDIFPADALRTTHCMQKDALLSQLVDEQLFSMTYRLMQNDVPVYYNLKAAKASTHDNHHIVIGVGNVDAQVKEAGIIGNAEKEKLLFPDFAKALSNDMEALYYVDVLSEEYMELKSSGNYHSLPVHISGKKFFEEFPELINQYVYAEDCEKFSSALQKDTLLDALQERPAFYLLFRLVIEEQPVYYRLKAVWAGEKDKRHMIIGIGSIDEQISDGGKLQGKSQSEEIFSKIARALSMEYDSIYYVDTETDRFLEYGSDDADGYRELNLKRSGDDFFTVSRKNIFRVISEEDKARFSEMFTKEHVIQTLNDDRMFSVNYRAICNGVPTYMNLKANRMPDPNDPHIVIGISSANQQGKCD